MLKSIHSVPPRPHATLRPSVPPALPRIDENSGLWRSLREALSGQLSGEIAVRCNEHTGRIHLEHGEIAWIQLPGRRTSLGQILAHGGLLLDEETSAAALEECRQTGAHFAEVISAWGLATEEQVRESVRCFLAEQLWQILAFQGATALFLPARSPKPAYLTFSLEEIAELPRPGSGVFTVPSEPPVDPAKNEQLARVAAMAGVQGVALLDRGREAALVTHGAPPPSALVSAALAVLAVLGEDGAHALLGSRSQGHAALALGPTRALLLSFDPEGITQGRALALLREMAR